jgi:hypothetical protein
MPQYFYHAEGCLPGGLPPPIRITHFEFHLRWQGLSFAEATQIELQLMSKLLKAGFKKLNGVYPGTYQESQARERLEEELERDVNNRVAEMAAHMERLRMHNEELKGKRKESPPQSPKGSLGPRDADLMNADNTPARHLSEPYAGTLGAGLDISPLRIPSSSRAIPIKDPKMMRLTPTKLAKRPSFAVEDTIHEESEGEEE